MSTQRRIYLDFNATAPLSDAARAAMSAAMAEVGNPSSVHAEGRRARDRVERARGQVAALVGRPAEQIVFTSGGTEANALGVLALAKVAEQRGLPKVVVTSPIEHPSLAGAVDALAARGWEVRRFRLDATARDVPPDEPSRPFAVGLIELPAVAPVGLVAVGLVNHELGVVQDLAAIAAWTRAAGGLLHVDAVQAAGKLALAGLDADAIAISAHKIGGPQGAGALAISVDDGLPVIVGGHQERGRRAGTENTLGLIGFGAAAATIDTTAAAVTVDTAAARGPGEPSRIWPVTATWTRVAELGADFESPLYSRERIGGITIHGRSARERVGGTINVWFHGALGESIVQALDLAGVATSTGAACTSGSIEPSRVLLALGLSPDQARESVRFSLGRTTTKVEVDEVLDLLAPIVERARKHR